MIELSATLRAYARFPLGLLLCLLAVVLAAGAAPAAGRVSYALEVVPGLLMVGTFAALYPRLPLSYWTYSGMFLHVLILVYGGYYTYALTPLGDWAREAFGLARNHYDRVGHLALGVFPAFTIREVLLRRTPLRRGTWLNFLVLCVVLAFAAFWELLEWWVTLIAAADVGQAFLGSQGDVWDAQWDMFLAFVGAALALALCARAHDASMAKVPSAA